MCVCASCASRTPTYILRDYDTFITFFQRSFSFSKEPSASVTSKYRPSSSASHSHGTPKQHHTWQLRRPDNLQRRALRNPTLLNAPRRKVGVAKPQLPENWVGLVGVAETLEQFSKDEIKRQEVGGANLEWVGWWVSSKVLISKGGCLIRKFKIKKWVGLFHSERGRVHRLKRELSNTGGGVKRCGQVDGMTRRRGELHM